MIPLIFLQIVEMTSTFNLECLPLEIFKNNIPKNHFLFNDYLKASEPKCTVQ